MLQVQNERPFYLNECRIYKVPLHLRKWNKEAYTPNVISIGPYHHNKNKFQTMEKLKERYFKHFMLRTKRNPEDLLSTIKKMGDSIQCCYVETVQLNWDDFAQMILLDATFILELFWKYTSPERTRDGPMFEEAWRFDMVKSELLLLENQLPFFVIEELYHLAVPYHPNSLSLIQLTFCFFKSLNILDKAPESEIQHFGDLLRFFQLPNDPPERQPEMIYPQYSATQLHEAGVKFKLASSKCILDLNFEKGVLEIPLLDFQDNTEAYVRNIMALEQCDFALDRHITDFYLILDGLINTAKDVDLLCDKGIIVNSLGDNNVITSMINKLNRGIFRGDMNTKHYKLCEALNKFYEVPCHRWKALLRHKYFSTPWGTASTIAAVILLVLTLIQTVCSIIQIVPIVQSW
ncbi:hypothetical protein ACJW31_01G369200 [Castanea mollissima]